MEMVLPKVHGTVLPHIDMVAPSPALNVRVGVSRRDIFQNDRLIRAPLVAPRNQPSLVGKFDHRLIPDIFLCAAALGRRASVRGHGTGALVFLLRGRAAGCDAEESTERTKYRAEEGE
jgi:hypothetical protein